MRTRRFALALGLAALAAGGCGSPGSTLGPLTIEPPPGWLVVDREPKTLKVANGTIAQDTASEAGSATAVFDVYVDAAQSVAEFRDVLDDANVDWKEDQIDVDGYEAVIVSYRTNAFGPSTEVAFVPEWDVQLIYRAAFADAESAFVEHRSDFHDALASITFEGRPPDRA